MEFDWDPDIRRDRLNDMSVDAITKVKTVRVKLDPANPPPPSDWSKVDKLTEQEIQLPR